MLHLSIARPLCNLHKLATRVQDSELGHGPSRWCASTSGLCFMQTYVWTLMPLFTVWQLISMLSGSTLGSCVPADAARAAACKVT